MHGDTYDKVLEAADRLLMQGVRPTQQRIKEELGKGSISTINKALNDWWGMLGLRINKQSQLPDIPDNVSALMQSLWEASVVESARVFEAERLAQRDELKRAKAAARSLRDASDREKGQLLERLNESQQAIGELQRQVRGLQQELRDVEQQLLCSQKASTELERENRTLNATVAHLESRLAESSDQTARERALQQENINLRRVLDELDRRRVEG